MFWFRSVDSPLDRRTVCTAKTMQKEYCEIARGKGRKQAEVGAGKTAAGDPPKAGWNGWLAEREFAALATLR
jgi:hypothetical protein